MATSKFAGTRETEVQKGGALKTTFIREVTAHYRWAQRDAFGVRGPEDAADFMREILPDNSREHLIALYLDGAHKVAAYSIVSTGTANACPVHPREVFQNAVLVGAVSLIIGHNHPSGGLNPSEEDKKMTEVLKNAGDLLGIKLLDHLILGHEAEYSIITGRAS